MSDIAINIKRSISSPIAIDIGNRDIQGRIVSKTIQFALFTNNMNAVWASQQQLRKMSYPFAILSMQVNRNAFRLEVGDCFKFSYSGYGISDMICRVLRIREENPESENIIIDAMEDVYSIANTVTEYTAPESHAIPAPDYTTDPLIYQKGAEALFIIAGNIACFLIGCRSKPYDLGFHIHMSIDGGNSYSLLRSVNNLAPFGKLVGTYPANTYTIDNEIGLTIDFVADVDNVETVTWPEVFSGNKNVALLGDEIISFQSITPVTGTQYKLEGIIRGRFGTAKQAHAADEWLFVIPLSIETVEHAEIVPGVTRKFKLVPYNIKKSGDIAKATAIDIAITGKARTPYMPVDFNANSRSFAARYDTDIDLTWSPRYRGKGAGIGIPGQVLADTDRDGLFEVEVWVDGVKKRTTSAIDATTWTYTQAMNIEDNGSLALVVVSKLLDYRTDAGITYKSAQAEVTCKKN